MRMTHTKKDGSKNKIPRTKNKKLPNGNSLGGKGGLTDASIIQLQEYYGIAIRRNCSSVKDMELCNLVLRTHKNISWSQNFKIISKLQPTLMKEM